VVTEHTRHRRLQGARGHATDAMRTDADASSGCEPVRTRTRTAASSLASVLTNLNEHWHRPESRVQSRRRALFQQVEAPLIPSRPPALPVGVRTTQPGRRSGDVCELVDEAAVVVAEPDEAAKLSGGRGPVPNRVNLAGIPDLVARKPGSLRPKSRLEDLTSLTSRRPCSTEGL
jgi:hypothetical protein